MPRPTRNTLPPADDTLPPESQALMERAEAATQEMDLTRMAASRTARYAQPLMLAGRMHAFDWMGRVSDLALAQAFDEVRRSKSYIGLPYQDADGNPRTCETLEEYCDAFLGRSRRRCAELADALHLLGPELYEATKAIGFKTKDYRALKALPEDARTALAEALEESKDTALEVLSELVARHTRGRESAERRAERSEQEAEELRANYDQATAMIGEAQAELRRLKSGSMPPPSLDQKLAAWGPAVTFLIGEIKGHLAQLAQIVESTAQLDWPDLDDADAVRAWRAGLTLVNDAADVGLAQVIEIAQSVQLGLERGVQAKLYGTGEDAPALHS